VTAVTDDELSICTVLRVVSDWLRVNCAGETSAMVMHMKKRTILHLLVPKVSQDMDKLIQRCFDGTK